MADKDKIQHQAPAGIVRVRHREGIDPSIPRIARYWRKKDTGILHEVQKFRRHLGPAKFGLDVILLDPKIGRSFVVDSLEELKRDYEPVTRTDQF